MIDTDDANYQLGIQTRNVISHAEGRTEPVPPRGISHLAMLDAADWQHADMQIYRERLRRLARRLGVSSGPRPAWVDPHC